MDRTVPRAGNDAIALYERTYWSLLRSSREVPIRTLVDAHARTGSALHAGADEPAPDMSAFVYAVLRMPACLDSTRLVVLGQSERVFAAHGYADVERWTEVSSPARRRRQFWDGRGTIGMYIASRSDVDDIVPILVAYQIERDKLMPILDRPNVHERLEPLRGRSLEDAVLTDLADMTGLAFDDLDRLRRICGDAMVDRLLRLADSRCRLSVRLLSGSLAEYRRATRRWWKAVEERLPAIAFEDRPVYFISSNMHSMANLLSSFALQREPDLAAFIDASGNEALQAEYQGILEQAVPSRIENFLYYVLKKLEQSRPELAEERLAHERALGIHRVPSEHVFDVDVQVVELGRLHAGGLDPRLRVPGIEKLVESDALIVNIDFPLGMAAYQVLSEIARNIAGVRGVYVMGKSATLNGRIGDVLISGVVHDEHSRNTYLFENRFKAGDVAPHLVYGSVLDNQKAISVLGTFLQNDRYMAVFYKEGYSVMEMEAGPFLSSIYEMTRPTRYPRNEVVDLHAVPFPIGILHYASDTPMSKGKNLGAQNLSYFGVDPTYATMIAILRAVLGDEVGVVGG